MHPNVESAFDEIDAAIFSGDTFFDEDSLKKLKAMLERWGKQIPHLEEMAALDDEDED